ncbi:FixH family protein [Campylobacter sp. RM16187]|uniref:FixH family protein n=1 Tax=Campylobacter sp. RM16187 TaxID=1660063 RepID=UPI0021B6900D|nr:FixH family protein [Campylobacter sp. RM16187]QKG30055.1 putative cytochrome c oxidase-associated protein CcoH [Campylobacter sp. RM16187]
MQDNTKTFWPYAIVLSIIAIVIACIATIMIALKNPVQMDTFYIDRYQNVDENINKIHESQKRFDSKFSVIFNGANIEKHNDFLKAIFEFTVTPKDNKSANLNTQILLTRPETNELNQNLEAIWQNQKLITKSVKLTKKGRWQLLLKLNDGTDTGFYKFEIEAK